MTNLHYLIQNGYNYYDTVNDAYLFNYELSLEVSLAFSVKTDDTVNCSVESHDFGTFTLAVPKFSENFTLFCYIKSIKGFPIFSKFADELKDVFENYIRIYENGYSFENFQKGIQNRIPCSFTLVLSCDTVTIKTSLVGIHYHPILDKIFIRYSKYDKDQAVILTDFPKITLIELLKKGSVPEALRYARKLQIQKMLCEI